MTTVATTNPQEVFAAENPQEVFKALSKLAADCPPEPHPELNGYLVKLPKTDPIYLIIDGKKCHVPNPETFNNLFLGSAHVEENSLLRLVSDGQSLETGAMLIKANGNPTYYLLTNGKKRKIHNPDVLNQYQFLASFSSFPPIVVNSITNGDDVPRRS